MSTSIKYIANGTYGNGNGSWNPDVRGDTASKKKKSQKDEQEHQNTELGKYGEETAIGQSQ